MNKEIDIFLIILGIIIITITLIINKKRNLKSKLYPEKEVIKILTAALNTSILRNDMVSIPEWLKQYKNDNFF